MINMLRAGFPEKVYEIALAHELRKTRMFVELRHRISVMHDGTQVGEFVADLLLEDCLLLENQGGLNT